MEIACNYYLETEDLVKKGIISINYFKYPALSHQLRLLKKPLSSRTNQFFERITKEKPVLLHGFTPCHPELSDKNFVESFNTEIFDQLLIKTKSPGISFHPTLSPVSENLSKNNCIETIINNIDFLKRKYVNLEFVSLENLDTFRFNYLIDPDVISKIVYDSGCDFLLDISHAFCAAKHFNIPFEKYIEKLPLNKVHEIHVNGWVDTPTRTICHLKFDENANSYLKHVLSVCKPKIITLEYGRSDDILHLKYPRIRPSVSNELIKNEIIEQLDLLSETIQKTI